MPTLSWLDSDYVRGIIEADGCSIDELLLRLQAAYPDKKLSERNLKRFLSENNITKYNKISDTELDGEVATASSEVGGTYGRKMMRGYLASKGLSVSEHRIQKSQVRVAPHYHRNRSHGVQNQLNPQSYFAPYFGYNLHMDQNEKLVDYGIVFVLAVDGCSGYIVQAAVMPRKNNIAIYQDVFCPAVQNFGLWDCLIFDHGREFYLVEFIQDYLSNYRVKLDGSTSVRPPYKQLASTQNNRVERMWGEVNPRVGYPIKWALTNMESRHVIDSSNPVHLFAISQVGMAVARAGIETCVCSWNSHPIPHSGIPNEKVDQRQNYVLPDTALPFAEEAVELYLNAGGQLTEETPVGRDLLQGHPVLQMQRNVIFWDVVGSPAQLFSDIVNDSYGNFEHSILYFIELSEEVCRRNFA